MLNVSMAVTKSYIDLNSNLKHDLKGWRLGNLGSKKLSNAVAR